jgi:hypothetical protein
MGTSFDQLLLFIKNNYLLAVFLLIGYVLGQFNNIINFVINIIEIKRLKNKLFDKENIYVNFNKDNFEKETNVRFGFSFLYPKTWDRKHPPSNSDGNTYIHPKNQNIKMLVWGCYYIEGITSLVLTSSRYNKNKKVRIILDVESGKNHDIWSAEDDNLSMYREQLEGRRIVFQFERNKKKITAMESIATLENIEYHMLFEAPSKDFSKYEDLFIFLNSNLKILQ